MRRKIVLIKKDGISIHKCAIHRKNGTSESAWLVKHSGYGGRQKKLILDSNGRRPGKGAGGVKFVQQALLVPSVGPPIDLAMSTMEYDENLPQSLLKEKYISQQFNKKSEIQGAIINSFYFEMRNRKSHRGSRSEFAVLGRKSEVSCKKLVGFMPILTGTAKSLIKCSDKEKEYGFILNALTSLRIFAEHEIVHGDIKPDNISETGQFLDFGGSAIKPKDNECKTMTENYVSIWQWKEKSQGRQYHKANDKFRQDSYGLAMTILHLFCPELLKELEKNIRSLFNGNGDFNKDIQIMVTKIQEQINQTEFPVFNSDEFRTLLLDMTGNQPQF